MKKVMSLAGVLVLATFGFVGTSNANVSVNDGCDIGAANEALDIDTLSATFDTINDLIIVEMVLCGNTDGDPKNKYRVHFDHTAPLFHDADRNSDQVVDENDFCATTSDDTMMHRSKKDTGPGMISSDTNRLTFTVPVNDLNPALLIGDTVYIWADTHGKKVGDRAPNTEGGDGCSKPEVETEVLALTLEPACATGDPNGPAPVITNIVIGGVTNISATVTWTTDIQATSQLEVTEALTGVTFLTAVDTNLTTSHSVTATNLKINTIYFVRVYSDGNCQEVVSAARIFRTLR